MGGLENERTNQKQSPLKSENGKGRHHTRARTDGAAWAALGKPNGVLINPWAEIARKRLDGQSRLALREAEITQLLTKTSGEIRDLIIIGLRTGLRLGDACQLKWEAFKADGT